MISRRLTLPVIYYWYKYDSYPDWRISPHADRRKMQIVYNTGHHRPCGGQFSHHIRSAAVQQVCCTGLTTVERVIDFSIFDLGAYPWAKVHQKGRWPTIHRDLPSYKISAQSHKWYEICVTKVFSTFWPRWFTPGPKFIKRGDDLVDS